MKKVFQITHLKYSLFHSLFFSFLFSKQVLISKSPVAPFASFVYTIHAQGIVLERQDLPGQGECMRKYHWTFLPMSRFSDFFIQTKNRKPHRSIYRAEFSKYATFHKNPLQAH